MESFSSRNTIFLSKIKFKGEYAWNNLINITEHAFVKIQIIFLNEN